MLLLLTVVFAVLESSVNAQCGTQLNSQCITFVSLAERDFNQTQNLASYCGLMTQYMNCFNMVFAAYCGTANNKTALLDGNDETFYNRCGQATTTTTTMTTTTTTSSLAYEICVQKLAQCPPSSHRLGPSNNATSMDAYCNASKARLQCLNQQYATCDQTLNKATLMGNIELDYDFECRAGGRGYCPGMYTCMNQLTPETGSSWSSGEHPLDDIDLLEDCTPNLNFILCLNSWFVQCGLSTGARFPFSSLAGPFRSTCQALGSKPGLRTCADMETCLDFIQMRTQDPYELMALNFDPILWCSYLRTTLFCATEQYCIVAGLDAMYAMVASFCPEAPILVSLAWRQLAAVTTPAPVITTQPTTVTTVDDEEDDLTSTLTTTMDFTTTSMTTVDDTTTRNDVTATTQNNDVSTTTRHNIAITTGSRNNVADPNGSKSLASTSLVCLVMVSLVMTAGRRIV